MASGADHYRRAEQLAAEAYKHLGQENEQSAAAWAAVAQVYATLADAAATAAAHLEPSRYIMAEWEKALGVAKPGDVAKGPR